MDTTLHVKRGVRASSIQAAGTRPALLLLLVVIGVSAVGLGLHATERAGGPGGGAATATMPRLKTISSQPRAAGASLLIESTEPVAYATSAPDSLTVLVDLHNVRAAGFVNAVAPGTRDAIRDVTVEDAGGPDGTIARVRVTLARGAAHHVRSSRNVIYVDVDRSTSAPSADSARASAVSGGASLGVPATVLQSIRSSISRDGTVITLMANGRLKTGSVFDTKDSPRIVMDFPNVAPGTAPRIDVEKGAVRQVRVARKSETPLVTRVVVDLARPAQYRLEQSSSGEVVKLLVEDVQTAVTSVSAARRATTSRKQGERLESVTVLDPIVALAAAETVAPGPLRLDDDPDREEQDPAPAQGKSRKSSAKSSSSPPKKDAEAPPAPSVGAPVAAQRPAAPPPSQAPPSQPKAASVPDPIGATVTSTRQYTGHPVSLDFQGADLRAVLRTFSEISGLNIVIDPAVQGSVDVALRDVPWDQALDIILRANKLGYIIDGSIVRIAPLTVLADEEGQRRKLADEQALAGELRVLTRGLSYARAEDLVPLLRTSALTPRGNIQFDARSNTLIISDLQNALNTAADLITTLDKAQPQVEIEARIVQTNRTFAREIGVQWGFAGRVAPELGNTTPLTFPNQGTLSGTIGSQGPSANLQTPTAVNLGVAGASSAVGLALGSVNGAFNLDVVLTALEKSGQGRLLSTPRVSTQNNIEAEITQGIQIPIQTIANNTITVTFKDAALTLKVTPQITAANTVIMKITMENATPDFANKVNGIPPINTQRANTQVLVSDGQTTVIGGIYSSTETFQNDRTPGLHRIPILGWLFRRDAVNDNSQELLIFITPHILRS